MAWSLKKILKLKNSVDSIFDIRLGDGRGTLFWHDPWFESRPLIDRENFLGMRIMRDCAASTVKYIHGGLWNSIIRRAPKGRKVLDHLSGIQLNDRADVHLWNAKEDGNHPDALFYSLVAFRRRLSTQGRIQVYMDISDVSCLLCDGNLETIDYLLGGCPFTRHVWNKFTSTMSEAWEEIMAAAQDRTKNLNVFVGFLHIAGVEAHEPLDYSCV
ncbi:uncharacterized protein LOC124934971 [Impatiens glandulifera]|uniref:uncharacterized protein LOC124934971 n=1 Tax=Impatiens glandulifera TaxID=253017 RepID=UPI001FB154FA|nr:uncharacterized protein LOC124934971 [Impatiens glandulifera]